jgi:hypothetical protein
VTDTRTLRYRGGEANLIVLRDELRRDPIIGKSATFELRPADDGIYKDSLEHGAAVELIVAVAVGVLTNGAYDVIKAAVRRAMSRGRVEDRSDHDGGEGDAGTSGT